MRTLRMWQFCAVLAVCSHRLRIGVASKGQLCPEGKLCLTCELGLMTPVLLAYEWTESHDARLVCSVLYKERVMLRTVILSDSKDVDPVGRQPGDSSGAVG